MLVASAFSRSAIASLYDVETSGTIFRGNKRRKELTKVYNPRKERISPKISMNRMIENKTETTERRSMTGMMTGMIGLCAFVT